MTHQEKRLFLIDALLKEGGYSYDIPSDTSSQKKLLRSLFNVREPLPISDEFLKIQDEYLTEELSEKGIVDAETFNYKEDIALYQGDITTIKADAIVNAANSYMLGCFYPCHGCIDNAIHTFSGIQLRLECDKLMKAQKSPEKTGGAKITKAYNLPCKYVLHTVGPIVSGKLSEKHKKELISCYESCLSLADANGLRSIVFCCISTGEFCFPNEEAAKIAIKTVKNYKQKTGSDIKVIFNVFKDIDKEIYRKLLSL